MYGRHGMPVTLQRYMQSNRDKQNKSTVHYCVNNECPYA